MPGAISALDQGPIVARSEQSGSTVTTLSLDRLGLAAVLLLAVVARFWGLPDGLTH